MPDLLVNLLKLPSPEPSPIDGVTIRRAQPFEIAVVRQFIEKNFSVAWADEISVGFVNKPVTLFIATRDARVVGFMNARAKLSLVQRVLVKASAVAASAKHC
jgi:hypothetical protein